MLKIEIEDFSCGNIIDENKEIELNWHGAKNQIYMIDSCVWVKSFYKDSHIAITFDVDKEFIESLKALVVFMESMEAMYQDDQ